MKRESCSITIITCNEEKNLPECLASVSWADEVVIVDSGSSDRTVEIARDSGCKVFHNPWPGMREQKNYASSQAQGPWILNLDADERVSPELARRIQAVLEEPRSEAYSFPRKNYFLGRWMRHGGWYPDAVLRLFRKERGTFAGINPHAQVALHPSGQVAQLTEPLIHYTYFTLKQYVQKQYAYADAAARELYARKPRRVSCLRIGGKTVWKFIENYLIKRGFLDGTHGLIAALGSSFGTYLKFARLWELDREAAVTEKPRPDAVKVSRP